MKKIFSGCLLLGITSALLAQLSITGTITDEYGHPLIGANVYVEKTFQGAVTDIDGKYTIRNLRNGTYPVRASYVGYNSETKIINLEEDTGLDFTLSRSNILADEVVVSATRAGDKSPVTYTNVSREEIKENNLGQDVPYLLSLTPSLVSSSDAGTGIGYTSFRIRGTDMNRINITVNGIPLNDAESHGVWWVDLPDIASSVENIQVQRGVGTSTNGAAAFGASMNLQTFKMNQRAYGELASSYGSYNTWKNSLSAGTGLMRNKFTLDMRLSKITSDGYIDRAFSDLTSWYIQGAWYTRKSLLKINVFSGNEKTYQAWNGVPSELLDNNRTFNPSGMIIKPDGDTTYYDNETDNYRQDHYQFLFSRELSESWLFNAAFHYTYGRGYYEEYRQEKSLEDYGINNVIVGGDTIKDSDLVRQKWLDNDFYGLTFSFNYRYNKTEAFIGGGMNNYEGRHFGKVIWARYAGDSEINHEWYRNTGQKTDANLFIKVNHQLFRKLVLSGDAQVRYIDYNIKGIDDDLRIIDQFHEYIFFNPRLGLHYEFNNNQRYYFSFAVANREPNRDNFVDADPSHPVPSNETLFDYELGYEARMGKAMLNANMYFMDYNNQLVLTGEINDVGAPIMTNVKDSYRAGVELVASIKPVYKLQLDMNLTLSRNKIMNFAEYVDNWDYWKDSVNEPLQFTNILGETDLAFSPGLTGAGKLSYEIIDNLKISFVSKYVGKQYIDNTSSEDRVLEPYFISNLVAVYEFSTSFISNISLYLHLNNLFNAEYETNAWVYRYYTGGDFYEDKGYFPQAGRNFMAGIVLRF